MLNSRLACGGSHPATKCENNLLLKEQNTCRTPDGQYQRSLRIKRQATEAALAAALAGGCGIVPDAPFLRAVAVAASRQRGVAPARREEPTQASPTTGGRCGPGRSRAALGHDVGAVGPPDLLAPALYGLRRPDGDEPSSWMAWAGVQMPPRPAPRRDDGTLGRELEEALDEEALDRMRADLGQIEAERLEGLSPEQIAAGCAEDAERAAAIEAKRCAADEVLRPFVAAQILERAGWSAEAVAELGGGLCSARPDDSWYEPLAKAAFLVDHGESD